MIYIYKLKIYQLYQKFYETWVKEVLNEWKEKPVSNTTCSYRYKSCALVERHFSEVDLKSSTKYLRLTLVFM